MGLGWPLLIADSGRLEPVTRPGRIEQVLAVASVVALLAVLAVVVVVERPPPTPDEHAAWYCSDEEANTFDRIIDAEGEMTFGFLTDLLEYGLAEVRRPVPPEFHGHQDIWVRFLEEEIAGLEGRHHDDSSFDEVIGWYLRFHVRSVDASSRAAETFDDATLALLAGHGCAWAGERLAERGA